MDFTALVLSIASTPAAFLVLAALLIIDGFFPLVPGETTVVALATLGAAGHGPHPLAVLAVATAATMIGDGIAFWIGRTVGAERWRWMRRPRARHAFAWAAVQLDRRPAAVLIGAKFLPVVRVAVTMTAGSSGLRLHRYLPLSFVSALLYTGYHVLIATVAGHTLAANPLLALAVSLGIGMLLGAVIAAVERVSGRSSKHGRPGGSPPGEAPPVPRTRG